MKNSKRILIFPLTAFFFLLIIAVACKKEDEPEPTPDPLPVPVTVKDIDGNIYHTVTIGTQTWMLENLKVTHYRNGDPIPHITDTIQLANLTTGAYINYKNNSANSDIYGRLYNWYAVVDGPLLAPEGWHIPSQNEWQILIDYLGGDTIAGAKLKEVGTNHWQAPNTGATNESGFTALPGGLCWGTFADIGLAGLFWSSTEVDASAAICMIMFNSNIKALDVNYFKNANISVRCIKD